MTKKIPASHKKTKVIATTAPCALLPTSNDELVVYGKEQEDVEYLLFLMGLSQTFFNPNNINPEEPE
jgi:hypothetical protein